MARIGGKLDVEKHKEEICRLVAEEGCRMQANRFDNNDAELQYTVHVGNLKEPVRGNLALR